MVRSAQFLTRITTTGSKLVASIRLLLLHHPPRLRGSRWPEQRSRPSALQRRPLRLAPMQSPRPAQDLQLLQQVLGELQAGQAAQHLLTSSDRDNLARRPSALGTVRWGAATVATPHITARQFLVGVDRLLLVAAALAVRPRGGALRADAAVELTQADATRRVRNIRKRTS